MNKIIFSIIVVAIMVTTAAAVAKTTKNDKNLHGVYTCEIELTGTAANLIESRSEVVGDELYEVVAINEEDAKDKFLKKIAAKYYILDRKIVFILEKVLATGIIVQLECKLKK